jgi:hypothetical protein
VGPRRRRITDNLEPFELCAKGTLPGVIEQDVGVRNCQRDDRRRDIKGVNAIMSAATVSFAIAP